MRDEIGKKYGRLTVIAYDHTRKSHLYYRCACDCGCVTVAEAGNLRKGVTKSCGCFRREAGVNNHLTHGHSDKERLYNIWIGIKQRCNNPNVHTYKYYGGKGVRLCQEWQDYEAFREWSYSHGYVEPQNGQTKGDCMSIDRINPDLDYSPDNCRWIPLRENISHMQKARQSEVKAAETVASRNA